MSKLRELLISTPIDQLVYLVKKRGSLGLTEAAVLLGVDTTQVEQWVQILEEHGYLAFVYPAVGEPQIRVAELPPEQVYKKKQEFEKRRAKIEIITTRFGKRVEETEKVSTERVEELQKHLKRELVDVEGRLKSLQKFEKKRKEILKESHDIQSEATKASEKMTEVQNLMWQLDEKINDAISKLDTHERDIKNLERDRQEIDEEIHALEKEMSIVNSLSGGVRLPFIGSLRNMMSSHAKRTEKLRERKEVARENIREIVKEPRLKALVEYKPRVEPERHIERKESIQRMPEKSENANVTRLKALIGPITPQQTRTKSRKVVRKRKIIRKRKTVVRRKIRRRVVVRRKTKRKTRRTNIVRRSIKKITRVIRRKKKTRNRHARRRRK